MPARTATQYYVSRTSYFCATSLLSGKVLFVLDKPLHMKLLDGVPPKNGSALKTCRIGRDGQRRS